MHLSDYAVILAAGSGIVAAAGARRPARASLAKPPTSNPASGGSKIDQMFANLAGKQASKPGASAQDKSNVKPDSVPAAARIQAKRPVQPDTNSAMAYDPPPRVSNPRQAALLQKADDAAIVAIEYARKFKEMSPQGLRDNQPPPPNFSFGNTVYGNDMSQTAYGGSNARDGASANQNTQVDNSMNDNRMQIGNGAQVGNISANNARKGANTPAKGKRDLNSHLQGSEDGAVTYEDFVNLVSAMHQNPATKNEALYEFAGVPGMRTVMEQLISQHTETDGQLTMNNFAALVDSMTADKSARHSVVDAINSNMLFALIFEKLLTKYNSQEARALAKAMESETSGSSKELNSRDFDDDEEDLELSLREIEEREYLEALLAIRDDDAWFETRDIEAVDYEPFNYPARSIGDASIAFPRTAARGNSNSAAKGPLPAAAKSKRSLTTFDRRWLDVLAAEYNW